MSRLKLNTSNKVDLSHLMEFQDQVDSVLTRDINRIEDKMHELMDKSEQRFGRFMEAMETRIKADRDASEARLAVDRKDFLERSAEDRKEFASQKRWLIGIFVTLVIAIITGAVAIASFFITTGNIPAG